MTTELATNKRVMRLSTFVFVCGILFFSHTDAISFLDPIIPPTEILEKIPVQKTALNCPDTHFYACQDAFNRYLNISDSSDWKNYQSFVNATDTILSRGIDDGLLTLCNARALLYQCLGAYYSSCISRFYFLRHGYSQKEAAAYVEMFKELEFMCTGGILQSINHWACIKEYKKASDDTYNGCLDTYQTTITQDPSRICRAAVSMALCARIPYIVHCGVEVGWWECERVRIALDIDSYCPTMNCYYNLAQPSVELVTRSEKYRQPNPYFMSAEKQALFASLGQTAAQRHQRLACSKEDDMDCS